MSTGYGPADRPGRIARLWISAWNAHDADRIAALFADDAEFVNVTGLWWHDRASIQKAHAYGFDTIFGDSTAELLGTSVRWLTGRSGGEAVAVVHAKMKIEGQTPVGDVEAPGVRRTLFSFVVYRAADVWHCASAHNTDVIPAAETHVLGPDGTLRAVSYRSGRG